MFAPSVPYTTTHGFSILLLMLLVTWLDVWHVSFFGAKAQLLGRYLRLNQHTNIIHGRYRPCSACRQQYHPWSKHWYGNFKVRNCPIRSLLSSWWLPATTFKICIYCYILIKLDHFPKFWSRNSKEILETTKLLCFFLNWQTSKLWNLDNSSLTSTCPPIAKLKQAVATCISLGRVHLSPKYTNFCWTHRSTYRHQEFTLSSPAICPASQSQQNWASNLPMFFWEMTMTQK